jgi:glycosyltransferase involved in cell wall biosynthesis
MKKKISIIIPTFNEEENIKKFSEALEQCTRGMDYDFEQIIIDNCSTDRTQSIIREICKKNNKIKAIFNSKNFGYIRSPYYGMMQAKGDAVILFSADFQTPPELIPNLIEKWKNGAEVVLLRRLSTETNFFLELIKIIYYKFISLISSENLSFRTTGEGLFNRNVINELKKINDPYPYLRGLIFEIVDKVEFIDFHQPKRLHGESKSNLLNLIEVGFTGIINHSKLPLRFITFVGFLGSLISFLVGLFFLIYKLTYWDSFQLGLAPLLIGFYFGISILILMFGIIGEYVGFIFTHIKKIPLVFEKERINFD